MNMDLVQKKDALRFNNNTPEVANTDSIRVKDDKND